MRFMISGVICVTLVTFFHLEISRFLFMGLADEARVTYLGFILGWVLGGWGALVAVAGFVQSGSANDRVSLAPTFLLLTSVVVLFFVLAYNAMTSPSAPKLRPGETIDI
jgi:uncharacterized membrane protein YcaP (DUF421 family)